MPAGEINLPAGTVRVDYYHAMGDRDHPGMVLGWKSGDTFETVPPGVWIHPGTTAPGPIEGKNGVPVPLATLEAASYLGYAGEWYAEVRARLPEAPPGWEIRWLWPDGKATTGPESTRLVFGHGPVRVRVRLQQGGRQLDGSRTLIIPRQVNAASVNNGDDIKRYLELLAAEIPASLPEPARRAAFLLSDDFASPDVAATWAAAWVADAKPAEGAWVRAQRASLRWLARTDPAAALRTLRGLPAEARAAMKESYPRLELDILVFGLQDPSVPAAVAALQKDPAAPLARFARIRLGDYHRLRGDTTAAAAAYQSASPAGGDSRKAPVLDKAAALAIESLLDNNRAAEARDKIADWEANRPLAKLESDFLYWQARVLAIQGDWQAALKELESSARVRPSSPEEIDVLFWKARALHESNRRDQAREAWQAIVRDYPNHELAQAAREWLAK
jgi:tetratricopeptide (TPR) repeat protein